MAQLKQNPFIVVWVCWTERKQWKNPALLYFVQIQRKKSAAASLCTISIWSGVMCELRLHYVFLGSFTDLAAIISFQREADRLCAALCWFFTTKGSSALGGCLSVRCH